MNRPGCLGGWLEPMLRRKQSLPLVYPHGGLNRNFAFGKQPAGTSSDEINMRSMDPVSGRERGGVREGGVEYISPSTELGSGKVTRLAALIFNDRRLTYTLQTQPPLDWTITTPNVGPSSALAVDSIGDIYYLDGDRAWVKVNPYGQLLWKQNVDIQDPSHVLTSIEVDEFGAVYVSVGHFSGAFSTQQATAKIWKWAVAGDGESYELAWTLTPNRFVSDMKLHQGILYTIQPDWDPTPPDRDTWIVWYGNLDAPRPPTPIAEVKIPHATIWTVGGANRNVIGHRLALRTKSAVEFIVAGTDGGPNGGVQCRFLAKVDVNGAVVWKFTDATGDATYQNGTGGIGYGCEVDSQFHVVSIGYPGGAVGEGVWLRRIVDAGASASLVAAGTWKNATSFPLIFERLTLAIDKWDNIYAPYHTGPLGVATPRAVRLFSSAGAELTSAIILGTYVGNATNLARACALPPMVIPHIPEFLPDDTKVSEFVYAAADQVSATDPAVHKIKILSSTHVAGSPRQIVKVGISGQDVRHFTTAAVNAPTGGTGAISANARYISATIAFGKWFIATGLEYLVFDPQPSVANPFGLVKPWIPTTSGILPPRGRLLCTWRGRVGIFRSPDDPHNFFFLRSGNPFDAKFDPSSQDPAQAFPGNLSRAGLPVDIPNALLDFSDDLCVIGCDHHLFRLTGNPLSGGDIDVLSDQVGMSFGRPFCKDPEGRAYFHGSDNGVHVITPDGRVDEIDVHQIRHELEKIDLSLYYVELFWNKHANGFHLFLFPYAAAAGTPLTNWFWERKTAAWHPDNFGIPGTTTRQPTAVMSYDGDLPQDRLVILAGENRKLWNLSPTARDDAGVPIYSKQTFGPFLPAGDCEFRFKGLEITLASDQDGCFYEFYVSDSPDVMGDPISKGQLRPGMNPRLPSRAKGRYVWIVLSSMTRDHRWAFENASVEVARAGRPRARS